MDSRLPQFPPVLTAYWPQRPKRPTAKTSKVLTKPIFSSSWTGTPYITFPSPFELRKPRDGVRPEENQQECSPLLILFSHLLDGWKWHEGALWGSGEWWTLDGERRTRVSEWLCAASPSPASTRLKWAMPLRVAPLRQPTLTSWLALLSPLELLFFSHLTHFTYS